MPFRNIYRKSTHIPPIFFDLGVHCSKGQRNIDFLPHKNNIDGFIKYHHESPDKSGPFKKAEGEIPLEASIIAAADKLDGMFSINQLNNSQLPDIHQTIHQNTGTAFFPQAAGALQKIMNKDLIVNLRDENINKNFFDALPPYAVDYGEEAMIALAAFFARIIDYKSHFTKKHSVQIANRAWWMSGYYQFDPHLRAQVYLAAALHDIGKLMIPTQILEKPAKLTQEEFDIIKSHVWWTHEILKPIPGFENIRQWAGNHHEKLDGSGYPFGKTGQELDMISRLMACIDIYQAVWEERPYHPRRTHAETMQVLNTLAKRNLLDSKVVADLDLEMAKFSTGEIPAPPNANI